MGLTDEVLEKFIPRQGEGIPVYLDQSEPVLEDPSQKLAESHWQPACDTTVKLTRCLEAIRDLTSAIAPLSVAESPLFEKRLIKQLVTPSYNFAIALRDLHNEILSNRWKRLSVNEQRRLANRFKLFSKRVPTKSGPIKTARDKIAAHLDKDVSTTGYRKFWDSFGLSDVLLWMRHCFHLMDALLPLDIYSWTRSSEYSNVLNLMNVDGKEVSLLTDENGDPQMIVYVTITESPRLGVVVEARELISRCRSLCRKYGLLEGFAW